jgi:hypothetical protein
MSESSALSLNLSAEPRPSWLDLLLARIAALPGPVWPYYLGAAAVASLAVHMLHWFTGALDVGQFTVPLTTLASWSIISLWVFHWVGAVAERSVDAFRPATDLSSAEARVLKSRLTMTSPLLAWLCLPGAALWMVGIYLADPTFFGLLTGQRATDAVILLLGWLNTVMMLLGTVRAVNVLAVVGRSHQLIVRPDLFNPRPLFAFSALTVRVAIAIAGMTYIFFLAFPTVTDNPAAYVYIIGIVLPLAVAGFILPLVGIHDRMAVEKDRLQGEINRRVQMTLGLIHEAMDGEQNLTGIAARKELLAALLMEKEHVAKTPTWPWNPNTLRSLVVAILLPLIIFVAQNLLERLFAL